MKKHRKRKKQKKVYIISISLILFLTLGYASFNTNININVKGNIKTCYAKCQLKSKVTTSGDGLYKDYCNNNNYIYRGNNVNNYLTFNDEPAGWRILGIEENNLKIIKENALTNLDGSNMILSFDEANNRDAGSNGTGGTYCNNASAGYGCNAWGITNNFINGIQKQLSGTVLKNASLNDYLNNNYYNSLTNNAKNLIQNHNFNIGGVHSSGRTLCQTRQEDEKINIWSGNIGLITVSDYIIANNNSQCLTYSMARENREICNLSNYLFKNYNWWFISPEISGYDDVRFVRLWNGIYGYLGNFKSAERFGVRPSFYLKANIKLKGEGTLQNPYEIDDN